MAEKKFKPPKHIQIDVKQKDLNRGFDELPFMYINEKEPHIYWVCNYDKEERITSVVKNCRTDETHAGYCTMEQAIEIRNQLISEGWVEGSMPLVSACQENWDALPKQQKKAYIRKMTKQAIREEKDANRKKRLQERLQQQKKIKNQNKKKEDSE